jgi:SAM-dependent methyltransferase
LRDRVIPNYAEAHTLAFAENQFDAIVSFDAYHYFGTDDLYLGTITRFLKPGGAIGIVVPGTSSELNGEVPEHVRPHWDWEFCSFHTPAWWRRHWEKTGLVTVERSDWLEDGWKLWEEFNRQCATVYDDPRRAGVLGEAEMLAIDAGRTFGFVRTLARRA